MARTPLTAATVNRMADLDAATALELSTKIAEHDTALDTLVAPVGAGGTTETKTSGALTVAVPVSYVSVTGTVARSEERRVG